MEGVPCGTAKRYSRLQSLGPRAQLHRTTWYRLPYGTSPEGPRRGCTVPWRTLRVARGTVTNAPFEFFACVLIIGLRVIERGDMGGGLRAD